LTFTRLHAIISQKTGLYTGTAMRISNPNFKLMPNIYHLKKNTLYTNIAANNIQLNAAIETTTDISINLGSHFHLITRH
jgi:hypothetical protein